MTNASHASSNKDENLTAWVAIILSALALMVSAGSLWYQKVELDHQKVQLANQEEELENQQNDLDNQQKELENQEEEIALAREAQEQAASQFEKSGAHFRIDTKLVGYQSSLDDAVTIKREIRENKTLDSADPDFLAHLLAPDLYKFSSHLPQSQISMIVTVSNTGRSAGLLQDLEWEVDPEESYEPEETLCTGANGTIEPCIFPMRIDASDAYSFIVPLNDLIQKELPCASSESMTMRVSAKPADYETYSESSATEIHTDAPCSP